MVSAWRYRAILGPALVLFSLSTAGAELTIFDGDNFQGRRMVIRGDTENLDNTGFNDQTSSIIVRDGVWQVCVDAFIVADVYNCSRENIRDSMIDLTEAYRRCG